MKVPIICYHSCNAGDNYASDDHFALRADLEAIHRIGFSIVPLSRVVDAVLGRSEPPRNCVALTCDDGVALDWHDVEHPTFGHRRSFANIIRDFSMDFGGDISIEMTSFVIASPETRKELEISCLAQHPWWSDDWWYAADISGVLRIESHSWDHVHPGASHVAQKDQLRGDFRLVETADDCAAQIDRASDFIAQKIRRRPQFFAYPYGQGSRYLRKRYLPRNGRRLGIRAAFSIDHEYVTRRSDRWFLPRFTHGAPGLQTPEDFMRLLEGSRNGR